MKTNGRKIGFMAAALALGLAGSLGTAQTSQAYVPGAQHQRSVGGEMKGTVPTKQTSKKQIISQIGGLDIIGMGGRFGMTPKEYGMIYGNGKSRKGKTNMIRVAKRARMKRKSN